MSGPMFGRGFFGKLIGAAIYVCVKIEQAAKAVAKPFKRKR